MSTSDGLGFPEFNFESSDSDVEEALARVPRNYAQTLVEVFSVQINISCNIYGTITLADGLDYQFIYNRKREESESIGPDNPALLIGPAQGIPCSDGFAIHVDLIDKDRDLPLVRRGWMSWNSVTYPRDMYDQPRSYSVDGDYGDGYDSDSVTVSFIPLKDAVEATVKVTLMVGDGEDPSHVYGRITACNYNFSEESVLFRKTSNEHIDVRPGQLIPLSRSVVAVPVDSILIVRADLWDYNANSSNVIAKGTAEFPTEISGTFEQRICSRGSEIRVKVTWK